MKINRSAIALTVVILAVASRAYCATPIITFKLEPTTDAEKEVAQVLGTLAEKRVSDPRGASELFTPDAVVTWTEGTGTARQERTAEGRERIYILFSAGRTQAVAYRNVAIKVEGDRAEAIYQSLIETFASSLNWVN